MDLTEQMRLKDEAWAKLDAAGRQTVRREYVAAGWKTCQHDDCPLPVHDARHSRHVAQGARRDHVVLPRGMRSGDMYRPCVDACGPLAPLLLCDAPSQRVAACTVDPFRESWHDVPLLLLLRSVAL